MKDLLKLLIKKLPTAFLVVGLSIVLVWFGVLTAVALLTHRSVDFWPPHIGTDKAIVAEVQSLSDQIASLEKNEQKQRTRLLELLVQARAKSIAIQQSDNMFGSTDAYIAVRNYEQALKDEDEKYLSGTQKIMAQIFELSRRL
jgi:hypothetical protein